MNFSGLRAIIKNVKAQVSCPNCENSYSNDDISVVSAVAERCILVAQCNSCRTPILITATIRAQDSDLAEPQALVTETHPFTQEEQPESISSDEVVDLHKFLKSYEGDIGDVLKKGIEVHQEPQVVPPRDEELNM